MNSLTDVFLQYVPLGQSLIILFLTAVVGYAAVSYRKFKRTIDELTVQRDLYVTKYKMQKQLIELSPVGFFQVSQAGTITFVSDKFVSLVQKNREQILQQNWIDLISPGSRIEVQPKWLARQAKGEIFYAKFPIAIEGGRDRWVMCSLVPCEDKDKSDLGYIGSFYDMSSMRQLDQLVETYKYALDESALVSITEPNGKIVYVNEKMSLVSGYGIDEWTTHGHRLWASGVHPKGFFENLWAAVTAGFTWKGEICNKKKDGSLIWLDVTIIPIKVDADLGQKFMSIAFDITERRRAEIEVIAIRNRLETALRAGHMGVWDINLNTQKVLWDSNMFSIFGIPYSEEVMLLSDWMQKIHIEDRDRVELAIHRAAKNLNEVNEIARIVHIEGIKYINLRGGVFTDQSGSTNRFVGVARDITFEFESQNLLKTQKNMVERIANTSPNLITVFSIKDCKYIYNNSQVTKVFGAERISQQEGIISKASVYPEDVAAFNSFYKTLSLLDEHGITECEYRIKDTEGGWRWMLSRATVFRSDEFGEVSEVLIVGEDIHERKTTLEELEKERVIRAQSAKMAALGEMAGGIAHEINNPLAVIYAQSNSLLMAIKRNNLDPVRIENATAKIVKTCERISKIIKGLSRFSRDGKQDPFVQTPLVQIIEDTLVFCEAKIQNSGIQLKVDSIPTDLTIECRPVHVSESILNLINNAVDAVVDKPDPWVEVTWKDFDNYVEIAITDSGNGIPDDIADKMMQPFFTSKEVGKGTGLGLSIITGIVQEHHGKFYYDKAHPNTRFVLELPKHQAEQSSSAA